MCRLLGCRGIRERGVRNESKEWLWQWEEQKCHFLGMLEEELEWRDGKEVKSVPFEVHVSHGSYVNRQ